MIGDGKIKLKNLVIGLICLLLASCGTQSEFEKLISENKDFSLAIVNGIVVDGTGQRPYAADLLVSGDEIVFIGKVEIEKINAEKIIDADGKIVTPGFIDVHAHGDPLANTSFENFLATGVTTILLGQDGSHPSKKFRFWAMSSYATSPSA